MSRGHVPTVSVRGWSLQNQVSAILDVNTLFLFGPQVALPWATPSSLTWRFWCNFICKFIVALGCFLFAFCYGVGEHRQQGCDRRKPRASLLLLCSVALGGGLLCSCGPGLLSSEDGGLCRLPWRTPPPGRRVRVAPSVSRGWGRREGRVWDSGAPAWSLRPFCGGCPGDRRAVSPTPSGQGLGGTWEAQGPTCPLDKRPPSLPVCDWWVLGLRRTFPPADKHMFLGSEWKTQE